LNRYKKLRASSQQATWTFTSLTLPFLNFVLGRSQASRCLFLTLCLHVHKPHAAFFHFVLARSQASRCLFLTLLCLHVHKPHAAFSSLCACTFTSFTLPFLDFELTTHTFPQAVIMQRLLAAHVRTVRVNYKLFFFTICKVYRSNRGQKISRVGQNRMYTP
jgi:hypothetical protein